MMWKWNGHVGMRGRVEQQSKQTGSSWPQRRSIKLTVQLVQRVIRKKCCAVSVIGDGLRRSCGKHARLRGDHDGDDENETMHSQRMKGVDRGGHIAWRSIRSAAL
jgi:hypothetical protein